MTETADKCLWLEPAVGPSPYPRQNENVTFDVAVLGGGIAGVTSALLLKREGLRVALIEARTVASGVSGANTAKVTALQSTVLSTVRRYHGTEGAAVYAEASKAAVEQVAMLARDERVKCDLHRRPAFTYASEASDLDLIEDEAQAAQEAGLAAVLTDDIDLPYPVAGAVRLDDQIEFHPVRYVRGLAAALNGGGSRVLAAHSCTASFSVSARPLHRCCFSSPSQPPSPTPSPGSCWHSSLASGAGHRSSLPALRGAPWLASSVRVFPGHCSSCPLPRCCLSAATTLTSITSFSEPSR